MKVGIDIGGSHIAIGVVDKTGRIIEKVEKRLTSKEKKNIIKFIEEYIVLTIKSIEQKYYIEKIGIAIPGRSEDRIIIDSGNLGIVNYPLIEKLEEKIKIPIIIKNDAKAAAMAEKKYGCLKGHDTSIFLTLGTGIGGAAFVDNKLLKGKTKPGYEFGHMIIKENGVQCKCGQKGCFERYASMKVLKTNLRKVLGVDEKTRAEELLEIIRNNSEENEKYQEIENTVDEYIENLSIGINNLIRIFEPEIIGIGGSFVYFQDVLLTRLKEKISSDIIIQTAVLGNDAGIIGATL